MKKFVFIASLCLSSLVLAAAPKISKACSKANGERACSESLLHLAEQGKAGDTVAIGLYGKTLNVIRKNKKLMKPVMVKVDSLVWEACKKKEISACVEACVSRTDSSFLREDAPDSAACAVAPQKLVAKKVNIPTPSSMQLFIDSLSADAFWNSPFSVAKNWREAIGDSVIPSIDSALAFLLSSNPSEFITARRKFHYCFAYGDSLNFRLDSLNAPFRCPVIGHVTDPRDNHVYRVERFGEKNWMIDNIAFNISDSSACYDGDSLNCEMYGRLYTFGAAQNACPEGFHVATDEEFEALSPMDMADFAVTVTFGGYFNQNGICTLESEGTYIWTATEEDVARGFVRNLFSDAVALDKASVDKRFGLSVRCVQE